MATTSTSKNPSFEANIDTYYENWLIQLENFLEKLNEVSASYDVFNEEAEENRSSSSKLVTQVLDHYQEYYQEKFKATNGDTFFLNSPPWYTSLERTFLWMAGFKPSMLFPTINYSIGQELTPDQGEKLKKLKSEIKRDEKAIEKGMAKVQESVAAPPIFELMKRGGLLVDGEASELETVIDGLKQSMMAMIEAAEHLRGSAVRKVLDILPPKQAVKLLAAVAQFHLQARKCGLRMDNQSGKRVNEDFIL
ncbi:protein RESPONSE TO ABA AND SALT 1-like [Nicotiana sylvestris]|uniref:Drought tolerance 1 n=1 Tax=Nicotiana sylvestris TaxID=4096 RepID=A0A1U7W0I1_NICSY|nr:PREDICTED: transcription factor TGA7-like [Nicotiana sylvestris]QEO24692.1 drought tolerance 1 [Nicotiana sylvestris]